MTQYNTLNVKLLNLQLNKSGIKNNNKVLLKLSWNILVILMMKVIPKLHKTFANDSSAKIELSETQFA